MVARSRFYRKDSRKLAVKEYFYGKQDGPSQLFPHSFDVSFSEVKIYKIGGLFTYVSRLIIIIRTFVFITMYTNPHVTGPHLIHM